MKVLLVDRSDTDRQISRLCLDNLPLDFEILEANNVSTGLSLLKNNDDIELFIIRNDDKSLVAFDLIEEIVAKCPKPTIIVQESSSRVNEERWNVFTQKHDKSKVIANSLSQNDFKKVLWESIRTIKNLNFDYIEEQYQKVRLVYFLRFNKVLCDVYIRIGEDKYIKIIHKGDTYTRNDFQKYGHRKVQFLYIRKEDAEEFGVSFSKTPFLIEDKSLATEDVESAFSSTVEIIHDLAESIGISEQVLNLVDYSVFQLETQLKKDILGRLLSKQREKKDYLYDHSYLVAYMGNSICMKMDWCSDETRAKLTFAAMLMDITLTGPDIALAYDLKLPSLKGYTPAQIDDYKQHPFKAAQLVRNNDKIPMNVDELIVQHHELPDGTGFPRGLSAHRVAPLSASLIVAHNFINELYIEDFNNNEILNILSRMKKKFSYGNYKGAVIALIQCFEKEAKILLS